MALAVTHDQVATIPDDPSVEVGSVEWNEPHVLNMDGVAVLGRAVAGTGPVAEIDLPSLRTLMGLGTTAAVVFGSIGVGMAAPAAGDLSALGTIRCASLLASAPTVCTVAATTTAASSHAFLTASRFAAANSFARLMLQTNGVTDWSIGLRAGDSDLHFFHEATPSDKMVASTAGLRFVSGYAVRLDNATAVTARNVGGTEQTLLQLYSNDQVYLDNASGPINVRAGAAGAYVATHIFTGTSATFPVNTIGMGTGVNPGGVTINLVSNISGGNVSSQIMFNNTAFGGGVNTRLMGVGAGGLLVDDGAGVYYWGVNVTRMFYTAKVKIGNNIAPVNYLDVQGGIAKTTVSTGVVIGFWSSDTSSPFGLVGAITGAAAAADQTVDLQTQTQGSGNHGKLTLQRFAGLVGVGIIPLTGVKLHILASGTAGTTYGAQLADLLVEGANRPFYPGGTNEGSITVITTTADAADMGGSIAFGSKYNASDAVTFLGKIKAGRNAGATGTYQGYLAFGTQTGSGVTEYMRLTSAGRLLINTVTDIGAVTGVAYPLQVNGLVHISVSAINAVGPILRLNNAGGGTDIEQIEFSSNNTVRSAIRSTVEGAPYFGALSFWTGEGSFGAGTVYRRMTIGGASGHVGIGLAYDARTDNRLDVDGRIVTSWGDHRVAMHYLDGATYRMGMFFNSGARVLDLGTYFYDSGYLTFSTNSERMRIQAGGEVIVGGPARNAVYSPLAALFLGANAMLHSNKTAQTFDGLYISANMYIDNAAQSRYTVAGPALVFNFLNTCCYISSFPTGAANAAVGAVTTAFAVLPTGFGYGGDTGGGSVVGSGGSVTQITSKATLVTINKPCGQITTHAANLVVNTNVSFQVNNSCVVANDRIIVHRVSGGTAAKYGINVTETGAGYFIIQIWNYGADEAANIVIGFAIIKGVIT